MSYCKENPRYNVVSIRITDEEKAALELFMKASNKSASHLLREALQMYLPQQMGLLTTDNYLQRSEP
ncbi:MAG TPA: CopG family transcriptional regulator [Desulfuromonadales bacterium]|nr:CopG family transcriptional regulator [Desulfuromonadales bacterium]